MRRVLVSPREIPGHLLQYDLLDLSWTHQQPCAIGVGSKELLAWAPKSKKANFVIGQVCFLLSQKSVLGSPADSQYQTQPDLRSHSLILPVCLQVESC